MKTIFLSFLLSASFVYAQTKGFVQSNVSAYVARCQDSQTPIDTCKKFDAGIFIKGERIEPLLPGNYVYYTTATLIPKTFSVSLSQKTEIYTGTYSTLDLYKLAPNLKNYGTSDYDSAYWFTISPDFNDPKNRAHLEDQVRQSFKTILNSPSKIFCDSNLTVAQAIILESVEICMGSERCLVPITKLDRETERYLDLLVMEPANGYFINNFRNTGQVGKVTLTFAFANQAGSRIVVSNESDFDSIRSINLRSEVLKDQPSSELYYVNKTSDLKAKTLALLPGKYLINIYKRADVSQLTYEVVDVLPFQID
jgi:hypothetical protein